MVVRLLVGCLVWWWHGSDVCPNCLGDDQTARTPTAVLEVDGPAYVSPDGRSAAVSAFPIKPYVIDTNSGKVKARLALPAGTRVGRLVTYSPDNSKIVCFGVEHNKKDLVLVCDASNGKLLQRVEIPDTAFYIMSLRFAPTGDIVYVGARRKLYKYELKTDRLTTLVPKLPSYVLDIAASPIAKQVAYIEGYTMMGLHVWSVSKQGEWQFPFRRKTLENSKPRFQPIWLTADYSADGSELAASFLSSSKDMVEQSIVVRIAAKTGKEISRSVISNRTVKKVRYVGDTKVLCVHGNIFSPIDDGCLAFFKPDSHELTEWMDFKSPVTNVAVDRTPNGHVTVGLLNGKILRWSRDDWPKNWIQSFK